MVILQINVDGVHAIPTECDPPVTRGADGPSPLAMKCMKAKPRQIDLLRLRGVVEGPQHAAYTPCIRNIQPARRTGLEIVSQGFAAETADHDRERVRVFAIRQVTLDV